MLRYSEHTVHLSPCLCVRAHTAWVGGNTNRTVDTYQPRVGEALRRNVSRSRWEDHAIADFADKQMSEALGRKPSSCLWTGTGLRCNA